MMIPIYNSDNQHTKDGRNIGSFGSNFSCSGVKKSMLAKKALTGGETSHQTQTKYSLCAILKLLTFGGKIL